MADYQSIYDRSLNDPEGFWADAAEDIHWYKKWEQVLDGSNPPFYSWFTGGELNTCYNAVDVHVENGAGDQLAIIYDSPVTDSQRKITYGELRDLVARLNTRPESRRAERVGSPFRSRRSDFRAKAVRKKLPTLSVERSVTE